jgi:methionyl aminopeptidase
MKLIDICNEIENANRRLIEANKIEAGIAFPTGCSINNCAAHFSPNPGDTTIL